MAATATLSTHPYPVGSTVSAYLSSQRVQGESAPSGAPAASAVVGADSSLAFAGLEFDTAYVAVGLDAGGVTRYVLFRTSEAASGGGVDVSLLTLSRPGALAVTSGSARVPVPIAATVAEVRATVGSAPTGADVLVDINRNGSTIFTTQANRPRIVVGGQSAAPVVPDVVDLAPGDYLTVDVDQVGSSIAGADLTVVIELTVN